MHDPREAIPAMTRVPGQDLFPRKKKKREPLGSFLLRGIILVLSNPASSIDMRGGEFAFVTKSSIALEQFSEHSAGAREQNINGQCRAFPFRIAGPTPCLETERSEP
jgi:hypothetical protein